ncbi:ARL14 effector protein-like isoform X2 [Acipenser ruthenus]|uniref:ARL14 effector protein-like isoform X2 n=1 Tax=Acipenser ruthenus TaxID=7906 RepID=UPI002741EBC5|nr:ARL14 effector protein-like isoform X2 [Acipenser ruthenus]
MADLEPCTVGVQLQATHDCHKTFYCRQTGCKALREMSPSNALLLQLRTGIMSLTESDRVCFHHEKVYVDRYEDLQKACCDPFNTHKKAIKKGLKPLDLDEAMFLSEKFARHLVPGWKLCFRCSQLLTGYCNLDPNAGQRKTRNSEGRTAKALKSLQFANPGRQTEFAAEPGRRDKRRLQPNKTVTNADRILLILINDVLELIKRELELTPTLDPEQALKNIRGRVGRQLVQRVKCTTAQAC